MAGVFCGLVRQFSFRSVCRMGGMLPLIKDVGRGHVIGQETDFHFRGDELHEDIIVHPVNGNGGIPVYPAGYAVHEAIVRKTEPSGRVKGFSVTQR